MIKKKLVLIISLIFFFCFPMISNSSFADELPKNITTKPFELGVVDELYSSQLSENRILNIYLPEDYDKTTSSHYPVIYLLDGSSNEDFIHIVGIVQFLTMINEMPKTIVVGIANVDRDRDFATTTGSDKFIAFIEKELQPYIQNKYRTNNSKTIIGQSLGGLLAAKILLTKPDLFNQYILVSPSLWENNEALLSSAPSLLTKFTHQPIHVFVSVGTEPDRMMKGVKKFVNILDHSGKKNLTLTFIPLPDENHVTILHNCVYKVLSYKKQ